MRSPSLQTLQAVKSSRREIASEFSGLLEELDLRRKVRNSVRSHPLQWLGSAGVLGLLASAGASAFLRRASAPVPPKTPASAGSKMLKMAGEATALSKFGWMAGLIPVAKMLYPIVRPVLMEFATKTVQGALAKKEASR